MNFSTLQKVIETLNNYTIKFGEDFDLNVISKMYCADCGNPYLFEVRQHQYLDVTTDVTTIACFCDFKCKNGVFAEINHKVLYQDIDNKYITKIFMELVDKMNSKCLK